MATWGTVFSAFTPHLEIIHWPGRVHSNVDPLSRLPCDLPPHVSLVETNERSLQPNNNLAELQEQAMKALPARKIEAMWVMRDTFMTTRSGKELTASSEAGGDRKQAKKRSIRTQVQSDGANENTSQVTELDQSDKLSQDTEEMEQATGDLWSIANPAKPLIHIAMSKELQTKFINGYTSNKQFKTIYAEASEATDARSQGAKFLKVKEGLLYILNADFQPRLCVPKKLKQTILEEAHESPMETAHLQMEQLWHKLSSKFYWRRMKVDRGVLQDL